jgi:hypothetical protein
MSEDNQTQLNQAASTQQQPPASEEAAAALVPATAVGLPPTAQTFFAVVNPDGSLARGFQAVSSQKLFGITGFYEVIFSHDLTGSAFVASIGDSGSTVVPPGGEVSVVGRLGTPNGVFIATRDSAGNFADRGFHLAVHS